MILDLFEFNSMIIGFITICILIVIVYKRINFNKYIPGLICFIIFFFTSVFEVGIYKEFFDFLEDASFLIGAFLLIIAVLFEYYYSNLKRNKIR